ncbi:glycosyltransferase family 4 protein, partial [bacterium]|nr:glycosyltransferase family 4 protein [bacterium]
SEAQLKCLNNILLITDLYPVKDEATIPLAIENFALALKEQGINITVIRPNFLFNTIIRGHKIYKQTIYERNGITIYNRNFFTPFLFNNFIPQGNYDLIISHMPSGNIYADLLNQKLHLPHIAVIHQSDFEVLSDIKYSIYFKKRLYRALNNAELTAARNSKLKELLSADFILPSFIEKENIIEHKVSGETLRIITLSRLIKRKNIDMVIEALKDIKRDFEYDIYGEGSEKKRLLRLIKKYNLEDKIKIHSRINHHLINQKLDNADVFILPSSNETFGLCYLEAMARGLVTIAKRGESMDNIINNRVNGFLVDDARDIAHILEKLTPDKTDEIIKNTLENIKNYEKEKVILKYCEIMKKII